MTRELKRSQTAAAKRIIKTAVKYSGKEALHGAWIDRDGMQCVCSNYHAARIREHITELPEIPEYLDPVDFVKLYPLDRAKFELVLPTAQKLRSYIRDRKAAGDSRPMWDFGPDLPAVNAQYLLDMLAALPGSIAVCEKGRPHTPIYFTGFAGDGLLCPVRKK